MNITELRKAALARLIGGKKNKEFADMYELDASYISQILNGHRPMGEKAARNLEVKIGLKAGTLVSPAIDAPNLVDMESAAASTARSLLSQATPRTQKLLQEIISSAEQGQLTEADAQLLHEMYKRIVKK